MRVETLTPVVEAAPGARARWRLRVENDAAVAMGYRLRVIGFDAANVVQPPPGPPLAAGSCDELDLELLIPEAFAAGHHSIAIEVTPDRPGVAPVIAGVTVTVGSIDDIAIAVVPSTIRARRRATFRIDIDNRSDEPRELELEGDSAELEIRMLPDRVVLRPGERVRTSGRIKAPRHLVGEPRQHSLTVAARSRSAPAYAPATFQQRSLFPRGLRTMLAVLLIVGIWGGALGAGYLWWQSRDDHEEQAGAQLVDTDGDGIPDTPGDQLVDTDGDGTPDTLAAVVAEQLADGGQQQPPQPGGSDLPRRTSMGGTVAVTDGGEATGVDVTLTPIDVGAPLPVGATQLGFRNGALREVDGPPTAAKFWPARFGRYQPDVRSGFRQTESVLDLTSTDERGVWFFGSVSVGQSYEVSFSRPGYDTRSFVVTPSADGKPVDLPVEMEPATGVVRGTVTGPAGPLGNVVLELTDGTLRFDSASASGGDVGTFSFTGVSTPGTYTLRATAPGLGTEVVQVTLEAGEERGGVDIRMRAGVGSISGRVTAGGLPLGGVMLTASNGDTTVETTSLTEGALGTYLFPRLDIPGAWTIKAELDGYVTQTRLVQLSGNATGIDFAFAKRTASIIGLTESSSGGPLPGVNIRVSRDDLVFETQSAVSPDPGSFNVRDLPPGTYLVELSRYDHEPTSQTVTVRAGEVADVGVLSLVFRPRPNITQNAALEVRVLNSEGNPITPSATAPGATVRVYRTADDALVGEQVGAPDQSSFVFQPMLIGTYRIEVTRGVTYRMATRQVSIGLSDVREAIPIYLLGQVHGRIVDSFDGRELVDYDVQIRRVNPDGSLSEPVQNLPVTVATPPKRMPDGSFQIRFETSNPPGLTSGTYQVTVDNPPPGYRVLGDHVLQPGLPPMRFVIAPDNDAPLDLGDIPADRFPELHGTVLTPRLDDAPAPGAPRTISFAPVDDDAMRVAVTCPGRDGVDATLTLLPVVDPAPPLPRLTGLTDKLGPGLGVDTFYVSPQDLEARDLFGDCRLQVSAPGYVTKTTELVVEARRGSHHQIHRNLALVRPHDVEGQAFWIDRGVPEGDAGRERPASGVSVRLQGDPVTRFDPGQAPLTSDGAPRPVTTPVAGTATNADGRWAFVDAVVAPPPNTDPATTVEVPHQVFGDAVYAFQLPGQYADRTVRLTISEAGLAAVGLTPAPPPALEVSPDGTRVELDAAGGTITSNVVVATIKGTPAFPGSVVDLSGFTVALTGANTMSPTTPLRAVAPNTGGVQRAQAAFVTPDPGTQQVAVTSTATADGRPRFVPAGPQPATFLQLPGQGVDLAPVTFIEQGAVAVRVLSAGGASIPGVTVNVTDTGTGTNYPATSAAADVVVAGLPASTTIGARQRYTVALAADETLDLTTATLRVTGENGALLTSCPLTAPGCGIVDIAQGGQPRVEVRVSRYGSITGTVIGVDSSGATTPLVPPALQVTARRVATADCVEIAAEAPRPATAVDQDGDGTVDDFRFSGPPGLYRIQFSHPDYQDAASSTPPQDARDICLIPNGDIPPVLVPNPRLLGPVYRVQNDVDRVLSAPFFTLPVRPSAVTVDVANDSLTDDPGDVGDPVTDATVELVGTAGTFTAVTDGAGQARFDGADAVPPGAYEVAVTKLDSTQTFEYFPIRFVVDIAPGGRPVALAVPLPRIGGVIRGTVGAVNSEGDAVAPPAGIVVTDDHDVPDPVTLNTNATVGTVADPAPTTADATPIPDAAPPLSGYEFPSVTSGAHTLSFNTVGGPAYQPPSPNPIPVVTVLGPVPVAVPRVDYRAANRIVEVTVRDPAGNPVDDATVELQEPDGDPRAALLTGTAGVYRFTDVPPELVPYQVVVSKVLFQSVGPTPLTVAPGDPAVAVAPPVVTLRGNLARISGRVELLQSPGVQVPLTAASSVQLVRAANGVPVGAPVTPDVNGSYSIATGVPDRYRVRVSGAGFATRESVELDVALGRAYPGVDLVVPALATVAVTVTGPPAASVAARAVPTSPSTPPPAAPTVAGSVFTFRLDPGDAYRFQLTSTAGYVPLTVPATPQQLEPGGTVELDAPMQQRTITGTISGAPPGTSVRAVSGATTIAGTLSGSTYTVTGVPDGSWVVQAAALGTGRGVSANVPVDASTGNVADIGVSLAARTVTIGFTTSPGGASIALGGGAPQAATGGALAIGWPEDGFPVDWTATADGHVPQSGTVALPPAPADPFVTSLATTVAPITLARPAVSATVAPATGPGAVEDAVVRLCPGTAATCGEGSPGAIPMPFAAGAYTVTPPASGAWTIGAARGPDVAVPVPVNVSAAGVVTPTPPVALTLVAPPPPPTTTTTTTTTTAPPPVGP